MSFDQLCITIIHNHTHAIKNIPATARVEENRLVQVGAPFKGTLSRDSRSARIIRGNWFQRTRGQERTDRHEDRVQDRPLIHTRVLNISATYLCLILTSCGLVFVFVFPSPRVSSFLIPLALVLAAALPTFLAIRPVSPRGDSREKRRESWCNTRRRLIHLPYPAEYTIYTHAERYLG